MNPFERLAHLLKTSEDLLRVTSVHNEISDVYQVTIETMGRWVVGADKDYAKAVERALDFWEQRT